MGSGSPGWHEGLSSGCIGLSALGTLRWCSMGIGDAHAQQ